MSYPQDAASLTLYKSGTSVLTGDPLVTVYSDINVEQMKTIPVTNVHRNANLAVVEADVEGYAHTHIIFPATIYGIAEGALFDAGVAHPHSVQLPYLIKAALARKAAGIVGMENALWPNVHIHDGTSSSRYC